MKEYDISDFVWETTEPIEGRILDNDPMYHLCSGDLQGTEFVVKGQREDRIFIYDSVERSVLLGCSILKFVQKFPYSDVTTIYVYIDDF